MKRIIVPLCLFALVGSLFVGMGGVSASNPNLVGSTPLVDVVNGDWSLSPGLYTYRHWGRVNAVVTISNMADHAQAFDMGDGSIITVPANSELRYAYRLLLKGQEVRIEITELTDTMIVSALALQIRPLKKGGD